MNRIANIRISNFSRLGTACIASATLLLAAAPQSLRAADDTDKSIIVYTGDLVGFIDAAAALANKVNSDVTPEALKTQLGGMLQDPGLTGMPSGAGAAFVSNEQGMAALLEVAAPKIEAYETVAKNMSMATARADGFLVVAKSPDMVAIGTGAAASVRKNYLTGTRAKTLVAVLPVEHLAKTYGPIATGFFNNAMQSAAQSAGKDDPSAAAHMAFVQDQMGIMSEVMLPMVNHVKTATITLTPSSTGLRIETRTPKSATATATKSPTTIASMRDKLPAGGALRFATLTDFTDFYAQMTEALDAALAKRDVSAEKRAATKQMLQDWKAAKSTGMAAAVAVDGKMFSGLYVMPMTDAKAAQIASENFGKRFKDSGYIDYMGKTGIIYDFKNAVREVDGIKINSMKVTIDKEKTPAAMQKSFEAMGGPPSMEMALVGNDYIMSYEPKEMDAAIKRLKSGTPAASPAFAAEKALGPNGFLYVDYNIGALGKVFEAQSPDAAKAFEGLSGAAPITIGGFEEGTTTRIAVDVPVDLLTKFGETVRNAAQQRRSGSPATP